MEVSIVFMEQDGDIEGKRQPHRSDPEGEYDSDPEVDIRQIPLPLSPTKSGGSEASLGWFDSPPPSARELPSSMRCSPLLSPMGSHGSRRNGSLRPPSSVCTGDLDFQTAHSHFSPSDSSGSMGLVQEQNFRVTYTNLNDYNKPDAGLTAQDRIVALSQMQQTQSGGVSHQQHERTKAQYEDILREQRERDAELEREFVKTKRAAKHQRTLAGLLIKWITQRHMETEHTHFMESLRGNIHEPEWPLKSASVATVQHLQTAGFAEEKGWNLGSPEDSEAAVVPAAKFLSDSRVFELDRLPFSPNSDGDKNGELPVPQTDEDKSGELPVPQTDEDKNGELPVPQTDEEQGTQEAQDELEERARNKAYIEKVRKASAVYDEQHPPIPQPLSRSKGVRNNTFLYDNLPDAAREFLIVTSLTRAYTLIRNGYIKKAKPLATKALETAEQIGYTPIVGKCKFYLGITAHFEKRTAAAAWFFYDAMSCIGRYVEGVELFCWIKAYEKTIIQVKRYELKWSEAETKTQKNMLAKIAAKCTCKLQLKVETPGYLFETKQKDVDKEQKNPTEDKEDKDTTSRNNKTASDQKSFSTSSDGHTVSKMSVDDDESPVGPDESSGETIQAEGQDPNVPKVKLKRARGDSPREEASPSDQSKLTIPSPISDKSLEQLSRRGSTDSLEEEPIRIGKKRDSRDSMTLRQQGILTDLAAFADSEEWDLETAGSRPQSSAGPPRPPSTVFIKPQAPASASHAKSSTVSSRSSSERGSPHSKSFIETYSEGVLLAESPEQIDLPGFPTTSSEQPRPPLAVQTQGLHPQNRGRILWAAPPHRTSPETPERLPRHVPSSTSTSKSSSRKSSVAASPLRQSFTASELMQESQGSTRVERRSTLSHVPSFSGRGRSSSSASPLARSSSFSSTRGGHGASVGLYTGVDSITASQTRTSSPTSSRATSPLSSRAASPLSSRAASPLSSRAASPLSSRASSPQRSPSIFPPAMTFLPTTAAPEREPEDPSTDQPASNASTPTRPGISRGRPSSSGTTTPERSPIATAFLRMALGQDSPASATEQPTASGPSTPTIRDRGRGRGSISRSTTPQRGSMLPRMTRMIMPTSPVDGASASDVPLPSSREQSPSKKE